MRIKFKEGTRVVELNDALLKMLEGIDKVFLVLGHVPTITSVNDGTHMQGSKHYSNEALDLRTRDFPVEEHKLVRDSLAKILGPEYDVVLEKDHIHLEHDI